ncbi:MAG TPA: efflux RND transporter periplasmic adaptor subunit [Candidatus Acidoferrum sp.]|nr:efflux RND transporter periplasmic adaptor subunit [Candidatus Acidoferrum sp.]
MSEHHEEYDPMAHEPLPEGEEAPPPYVKTMATIRWIILGTMTTFAMVMVLSYFGVATGSYSSSNEVLYHCSMHPTYISNQPGECPICGMTLVPITKQEKDSLGVVSAAVDAPAAPTATPAVARIGQYACPMNPQVISEVPGKCPICGMNLEKVTGVVTPVAEVSSDTGMANTPGMGTPAPPVRSSSDHSMSGMGSAPVPGLVPITIEPERLQLIGVRTGRVERRTLQNDLQLVGYVTPDETKLANIQVRFNGWVKELYVDQTGQHVERGDRLLSVYSQDLYQAEQDFIVARDGVNRVSSDPGLTDMRKQLLDAATQRLHLLGIPSEEMKELDTARSAGSELLIRSPFSGYVLEKSVVKGQYIGPDQSLFSIADLGSVWVLADLYEQDAASMKVGQKATMTLTAFPGEQFDGAVSFMYPTVDEQTRTMKVRLQFSNPGMKIRPGMYAEVAVLQQGGNEVLAVPHDAVMDGGRTKYAFAVTEGKHFEPRLLTLGRSTDDWVEVLSGLSEGEQVVTSANFLIDSESRLKAAMVGMGGTSTGEHEGHDH